MRAVVQRVTRAKVTIEGEIVGEIANGLVVLLGIVAFTITYALEAQSEQTSHAVKPVWVKARPVIAPAIAVVAVLVLIFVAVPEKFNDKPYNPLGSDTSMLQGTR